MSHRVDFEKSCEHLSAERGWDYKPGQVRVPCEDGRSQTVEIGFFDQDGRERVRLYSHIGSRLHIDPSVLSTALDLNFKLPHAAFAVHRDELVLTETLALDNTHRDEIAAALVYVATTADHYEKTIFGTDDH